RERLSRLRLGSDLDRPPAPLDRFERPSLSLPDHRLPCIEVCAFADRGRVVEPVYEAKATRDPAERLGVAAETPGDESLLEQEACFFDAVAGEVSQRELVCLAGGFELAEPVAHVPE